MRNLIILFLVFTSLTFASFAQNILLDNSYVIVGAGVADGNLSDEASDLKSTLKKSMPYYSSEVSDGIGPTFKIGLGYDINDYFALETYYVYLGSFETKTKVEHLEQRRLN